MSATNDPLVPGGAPGPGQATPPGQLPLPGAAPTPPAGDPPPADPKEIRLSNEQLTERLDRAKTSERKAFLKSLGFESEEAARDAIKAGEAARAAQLTAEQRLAEQVNAEKLRADRAEAELTEARFTARLTQLCATRGITDMDYARYLVEQAADGQDGFDAAAFLDQQLQNPQRKLALGVQGPPTVVPTPANTTPVNPNQPPPTPGPNGPNGVDVMKMSPAEFRAYEQKYHQSRS